MAKDQDCRLPVEEAGIIWDSVCFFFLLLQRRVFLSYYFLHVSADLQATALQASRSAAQDLAREGREVQGPGTVLRKVFPPLVAQESLQLEGGATGLRRVAPLTTQCGAWAADARGPAGSSGEGRGQ